MGYDMSPWHLHNLIVGLHNKCEIAFSGVPPLHRWAPSAAQRHLPGGRPQQGRVCASHSWVARSHLELINSQGPQVVHLYDIFMELSCISSFLRKARSDKDACTGQVQDWCWKSSQGYDMADALTQEPLSVRSLTKGARCLENSVVFHCSRAVLELFPNCSCIIWGVSGITGKQECIKVAYMRSCIVILQ